MIGSGWSIYTAPESEVTAELLETFLVDQARERAFIESMTLELKRERRGSGVVDAVCALANSAGGIVLVGIDEDKPTLAAAPGVPAHSVVALSDQLRGGLGSLLKCEIIPIPLEASENVVLLVRVEADPSLWPVVSNGRVMVRNPGQTVAATREQILDLAHRHTTISAAGEGPWALSSFIPSTPATDDDQDCGDLLVRLVTAVYARPHLGAALRIGSDERQHLMDVFSESSFGRLFDSPYPRGSGRPRPRHHLAAGEFSSAHFVASVDVDQGGEVGRLTMKVTRHGNQFAVMVEAEARRVVSRRPGSARTEPTVSREELAYTAICGVESLSVSLVPALVGLAGGAPLRMDEIYLWAHSPASGDLSSVLSMSRADRAVTGTRSMWAAQVPLASNLDDAVANVRSAMETFYIDIGMTDERDVARRDLDDGRRRRTYQDPP